MARPGVFRLPMFVIAAALLGLIALLATLQYRWLGQISDAERERMTATLNDRAKAFGEDVDRELTRAYLLFQIDQPAAGAPAQELATRYERWQATARFPRLIKDVYLVDPARAGEPRPLQRYDPAAHALESASWPATLAPVKSQVVRAQSPEFSPQHLGAGTATFFYRALVPSAWPDVPALVISSPVVMVNRDTSTHPGKLDAMFPSAPWHTVLLLDGDFMRRDMLPALARQHFRDDGVDYRLAVVPTSGRADSIFRSTDQFAPTADAPADARVDLFQVRAQDFSAVASEVSRFVTFSAAWRGPDGARTERIIRETMTASSPKIASAPFSIVIQGSSRGGGSAATGAIASATSQLPRWRLLVQHPSGSLESAVNSARRRNLAISSSVLGILGLSVALLFVSTRRANDLARQQLEFVATVSHELRTPLAVIRSAADNLADGVVHDELRVRQYGELVRREGVRLTDLVEQILEFAGLQSGPRSRARRPVEIDGVLREVASAAQEAAPEPLTINLALADRLPAVVGDEAALRRVFQNLIGNAVKYGAGAGWVGVEAVVDVSRVVVTVRDRGIGIAPADQERIFDPFYRTADVVSAQIQGAGLGLSLVKRIVEAHGGRVTVESAPGKGSSFVVSLPIASGTAAEGPVREAAAQHS
jgi:signal transduction histidine kinase